MISFDSTKPVVLVLTGEPGTGKSTLAGGIATPLGSSVINYTDNTGPWNLHPIHWHEVSIHPPLQALLAARTRIEGENVPDRQRYEILKTLLDLFNHSPLYGAPPFKRLIDMVEEIMTIPTNSDKFFLFKARLILEEYDSDILYKNLERTINSRFLSYKTDLMNDLEELEETFPDSAFGPKLYGVVISDVSSDDEWDYITEAFGDNVIRIDLCCDEDVRLERIDEDSEGWNTNLRTGDLILGTTTKVERMVLDGDPLPITDDDNRRGKSKGKQRCIERLQKEEFKDLLQTFRSIFQTESTNAQDQ